MSSFSFMRLLLQLVSGLSFYYIFFSPIQNSPPPRPLFFWYDLSSALWVGTGRETAEQKNYSCSSHKKDQVPNVDVGKNVALKLNQVRETDGSQGLGIPGKQLEASVHSTANVYRHTYTRGRWYRQNTHC